MLCKFNTPLEINKHCLVNKISCILRLSLFLSSRSGVLRTQKLKSHVFRTWRSDFLPFKPGAGPYIAMHATSTARDFFLANFYPSPVFLQNLSQVVSVLVVANTGSCVGPQNRICRPAGSKLPVLCARGS